MVIPEGSHSSSSYIFNEGGGAVVRSTGTSSGTGAGNMGSGEGTMGTRGCVLLGTGEVVGSIASTTLLLSCRRFCHTSFARRESMDGKIFSKISLDRTTKDLAPGSSWILSCMSQ